MKEKVVDNLIKTNKLPQSMAYLSWWFVGGQLIHRLELAVGDVLKELTRLNNFKIFFDRLYSLYHPQQKKTENWSSLFVKGLVIHWVASSERNVKVVWESYRFLQVHFCSAARNITRDSTEN